MKKLAMPIIVGLIILVGLMSFVSAKPISIVKQGDPIQLHQSCSDCTFVELVSVNYPNLSVASFEVNMTKSGESYTYEFGNTSHMGTYYYQTCGDLMQTASNTRVITCETLEFEVTPSGFVGTLGFYILILAIAAGIIIFGFAIQDAPVTILGSFGLYFVGIYIMLNGVVGIRDNVTTWAISVIILLLASYISIRSSYELITG